MRKPFYKASHKAWYAHYDGKLVRLGTNEAEAWARWADIQTGRKTATTIKQLCDKYLAWCLRNRASASHVTYKYNLDKLTKHFGHIGADDLRPFHIDDVISAEWPKATKTTWWNFCKTVNVAMNWAKDQKIIETNPIAGMRKPRCGIRRDWITTEDFEKLISVIEDELLDYLIVLWDTGARPKDITDATASHLDRIGRCLRYPQGKGEKPRIIYLTDRAFEICVKMADRRPDGPLFLNSVGKKWTPNLLSARMRTLKKRTGVTASAYTLRHSFATRAILAGRDIKTLAELMGRKDPTMVLLVYSHLENARDHLHDALKKLA
jgi:integrase